MSRIVQAVNAMISLKSNIGNVRKGLCPNEFYFSYNNKYVWSISMDEDNEDFIITNYPLPDFNNVDDYIHKLSMLDPPEFENIDLVAYSSRDLKTREAKESFSELYTIIKEKLLGIDEVLDDIIRDAEVPF